MNSSFVERFVALHDNEVNAQLVYGKGDVGRGNKELHAFGGMPHDQINKIREHYGDDVGWYVCSHVHVSTVYTVSTCPLCTRAHCVHVSRGVGGRDVHQDRHWIHLADVH